jgi:AcrR family transcriptional regulator
MEPTPGDGLRERHKRRRRDAILQAARELLRAQPDREPKIEQIAELAEVAPATVYNLVGTRARLWEALADDFMDELERRLGEPEGDDPIARVYRIVGSTVDLFVEDPIVSVHMLRGWEASGLVLRRGPVPHLVEAVRRAQGAGVLIPGAAPRLLASSIATGCVGAVHQWAAGLVDDRRLRARCQLAADVALAAAATEGHRERLQRALGPGEEP